MIKSISIQGFRGYSEKQEISFSLPNGISGSGLTFLVGANNSGKTTIIEAIRAFNGYQHESPSFSVGKRNPKVNNIVELSLEDESGNKCIIKTVESGGSSTTKLPNQSYSFYVLQSRRFIEYEFGQGEQSREDYLRGSNKLDSKRTSQLNGFSLRLFAMQKNKARFDIMLKKILGIDIEWTIDQNDSGNYFIKYVFEGITHSSEGIGDGIWSIFTICDALYDSTERGTIVIDEPELSIHPRLQKRLMTILAEESKNKQIIISTHSPYFVNWESICNGANLIRTVKEATGNIKCFVLNETIKAQFKGFLTDLNNPHVLGLNANEVFFLEDKIILVEGQEDIIILKKILDTVNKNLNGDFFGWGVGGATKMNVFLELFNNLGYKKVVAIYDGDKKDEMENDKAHFPDFKFVALCTDDIRDKEERTIRAKSGLTDKRGNLKDGNKEYIESLIADVNTYLR